MIVAFCGGVGGSKLASGVYQKVPPDTLAVVVNTADDLEFCGLRVSPDLDTVTYTLAGKARRDVGWGIEGDTYTVLRALETLGVPTWFQVGDQDFATHLARTHALRSGARLTEIALDFAQKLGVRARILPMTDDRVATWLQSGDGWLEFQEYFVHRRHRDRITRVEYRGMDDARPTEEVLAALAGAEATILVNSNPVLSIQPILSLRGIRDALRQRKTPCVAVSPLIGSAAIAGPAADLMATVGLEPTALGVGRLYAGLIDGIVIDRRDSNLVPEIEQLKIRAFCTDTRMDDEDDRRRLASETLMFARSLQ
ncbi:MAG TPA: 2-phospho-L-lactate transferase [Chloroflexota bacterium]